MAKILVHIHTGPSDPTKATLGLLVALTAKKKGHDVTVFLAGDAVHLFAPSYRGTVEGLGTGTLVDHLSGHAKAGTTFVLSGMSAKARGYDETLLDGFDASFGMPDMLVDLSTEADTVLCY
ncbi:DsrE family protein [Chachezhania antarctica]|uniref:DsrE family protein n=1 Tax=Chachezhania antarctica TaxID=2340860 RepID=UPI000EB43B39|nr:DsrE family protein [Chachezhania antarctica]|tara:strand:+ start:4839 stop:5201 length:363 start_codon:yes stop_codon:yes gene_type:complete